MFAGVMMSAIRVATDGRNGLAGWQWVFIIGRKSKVESLL
jgi:hypothetical protein